MKTFIYILFLSVAMKVESVHSKTINITIEADDLLRIMEKFYSLTGSGPGPNIGRSGPNTQDENPFHPEDKIVEVNLDAFNRKYKITDERKKSTNAEEKANYENENKRLDKENRIAESNNFQEEPGYVHRKGFVRQKKASSNSEEKILGSIEKEYAKEFINPEASFKRKQVRVLRPNNRRRPKEPATFLLPRNRGNLQMTEEAIHERRQKLLGKLHNRQETKAKLSTNKSDRRRKIPSRLLARRYLTETSEEQIDVHPEVKRPNTDHLEPKFDSKETLKDHDTFKYHDTPLKSTPSAQHAKKEYKILEETFESKPN